MLFWSSITSDLSAGDRGSGYFVGESPGPTKRREELTIGRAPNRLGTQVIAKTKGVADFSPDEKFFVVQHETTRNVGRPAYHLVVTELSSGKEVPRHVVLDEPDAKVRSLACAPDGKSIVGSNGDSALKVWDIKQGNQVEAIQDSASFLL